MIKLEYGISYYLGEKRKLIAKCKTIKEAFDKMMEYLDEIKYKSYYQRVTLPNNEDDYKEIWIDYGSHSNFFYINGFTNDEYNKWLRNMEG